MTSMRQYADRVVTYTRHPAVFAVCFQRDESILPAARIGRIRRYYVIQRRNYTLLTSNACDIMASSILNLIHSHTYYMSLSFEELDESTNKPETYLPHYLHGGIFQMQDQG